MRVGERHIYCFTVAKYLGHCPGPLRRCIVVLSCVRAVCCVFVREREGEGERERDEGGGGAYLLL